MVDIFGAFTVYLHLYQYLLCKHLTSVADPDPHLKSPPGSGSASVHLDPGGKKA